MFAEQQRQEIQKMANGPLEGVPEVLLLSAVSVRTFAMDIMGEIDKNEYNNRLEQWRKQGGDDIAAEYASLYASERM